MTITITPIDSKMSAEVKRIVRWDNAFLARGPAHWLRVFKLEHRRSVAQYQFVVPDGCQNASDWSLDAGPSFYEWKQETGNSAQLEITGCKVGPHRRPCYVFNFTNEADMVMFALRWV